MKGKQWKNEMTEAIYEKLKQYEEDPTSDGWGKSWEPIASKIKESHATVQKIYKKLEE